MAAEYVDDLSLSNGDRVSLWLMCTSGRETLKGTLRALRLPMAFDADLVVRVCDAADQMTEKGQLIESVPGWTTRLLRLRGIDLVRSPQTSRGRTAVHLEGDELELQLPELADALAEAEADFNAIEVRQRLGSMWGVHEPWRISAALTVLSVLFDGAAPGARCPQPAGGAAQDEAAHWVGLWYAGKRDVFPLPGEPAGNTMTKRRSRATLLVRELLRSAAVGMGGGNDE